MGVHHVSWQSTASGLEDEYIHAAALSWLVGDEDAVEIERMNSYHGSAIHIVTAKLKRRGQATKSLIRLGLDVLQQLKSELSNRMDDENVIHIRLDLLELIAGRVVLAPPGERRTIKGRAKLEVYPGQDAFTLGNETLDVAINGVLN
jgi:RNA binding exosome subunit|tara:strand:+ start:967 stop:1407 length:441 start_codon:yes stop_codon:yes gene_type:complete